MSYLEFLTAIWQKIQAISGNADAIMQELENLAGSVQRLVALLSPGRSAPAMNLASAAAGVTPTAEELELEKKILSSSPKEGRAAGRDKIGDGTLIRGLWAFIQANPALLNLVLTLLTT